MCVYIYIYIYNTQCSSGRYVAGLGDAPEDEEAYHQFFQDVKATNGI